MSTFSDRFDRQVIPSWHDSQDRSLREESASLREQPPPSFKADVENIREELTRTRSIGVAVDALNVAIVAGDRALADYAALIINDARTELPAPVVQIADQVLGRVSDDLPILPPFKTFHQQRIHELRKLVKVYPLSPLLHLDLARHFVTLGLPEKAERSIATALSLAPHNRVVLRATARFFFNLGKKAQKERAYFLIRDAASAQNDPWLIAAEIALSQEVGREPRHWRAGKNFLEQAAVAPIHLSELATAAGTIELMSGNRKNARRLFAQGLLQPTENSLAQARWAELRTGIDLVGAGGAVVPLRSHAFEADTLRHFNAGDMPAAFEAARQWFYFEPFSPLAATAMAHIGGLLDDYAAVEEFARLGLTVHPENIPLHNNYLYALISSGDLFLARTQAEAERNVRDVVRELRGYVEKGDLDGVHALANLGLLAYRLGQPETGRVLYERTIQVAKKRGVPPQPVVMTAAIFHAREAILARAAWAMEVVELARTLAKPTSENADLPPSVAFYLKKVEALAKDPDQADHILSSKSAIQFAPAKAPPPPVHLRVTKRDDGGFVVWVPPSALNAAHRGEDDAKPLLLK